MAASRLHFTTDLASCINDSDLLFVAVGTLPNEDGSADLTHVLEVARQIGQLLTAPLVVVDKSTVPVGTADTVKTVIAEELSKRDVSVAFDVVSNPEFLKEGAAVNDFMFPARIVVGTDNAASKQLMDELYAQET